VEAQSAAQTPDPTQQALEVYRRNSEVLKKFEIPMDTEPAFQFKP
jgi:hypothetical protein